MIYRDTGDTFLLDGIGDRDGKGADANVKIGGDSSEFEPIIHSQKWGEHFLTISGRWPKNTAPELSDDTIVWNDGTSIQRYYETAQGELEYELILAAPPPINTLEFDLDFSPSLKFWKQGPLTQQDIDEGCMRPDRVVNSYAIYVGKKGNQYKTGKLSHIYRPELIDSLGNRAWGDIDINPVTKKLVVTLPAAWLASANYPVILDPTVGYNTAGASEHNLANYMVAENYAADADGDAQAGTFYVYGRATTGTVTVMGGYYASDGSADTDASGHAAEHTSAAQITITTTSGWRSATVGLSAITNGTYYWITHNQATNGITNYDNTGEAVNFDARTHSNDLPDPWPTREGTNTRDYSQYIEFVSAATGQFVPTHPMRRYIKTGRRW